jgi:Uma2 family endonuclease
MATTLRWTVADLELFPQPLEDKRYEIIDGELYVSRQPDLEHQTTCANVTAALRDWSVRTGSGVTMVAPGIVFGPEDAAAPDVVWVSRPQLQRIRGADGMLHGAPELVVEVLSPGRANEQRDRDIKLGLYSRCGVHEYWIVDWRQWSVAVYRREQAALRLAATLYEPDTLESPLLSGFACRVADLLTGVDPRQ